MSESEEKFICTEKELRAGMMLGAAHGVYTVASASHDADTTDITKELELKIENLLQKSLKSKRERNEIL